MKARSFWVEAPGRGAIREDTLPAPGPGEVLVRSRVSGISRGTEGLVFRGEVPEAVHQQMRGPFQVGEFPGPVKYGYISVGVIAGGDGPVGQRVFSLHPHQDRYVVPADRVVPLPDDVTDDRATLAANLETALNASWDAGVGCGDRVVVVGAGAVGCLFAWLAARIPAARVQLVDINPTRARTAAALGCDFAMPAGAWSGADLVVHASASDAGLATAIGAAGLEATVLELSWYGQRVVAAPLGAGFHARRLTLKASQVGAIAASRRPRWSYQRRMACALSLLSDRSLDALLTHECAFEELPAVMARLAHDPGDTLCHLVRYPAGQPKR